MNSHERCNFNTSIVTDDYSQVIGQFNRDYYKGKSFQFCGDWKPCENYFNNEFVQCFVRFGPALLACKKDHISKTPPNLIFEDNVVVGLDSNEWYIVLCTQWGNKTLKHIHPVAETEWKIKWFDSLKCPTVTIVNKDNEVIDAYVKYVLPCPCECGLKPGEVIIKFSEGVAGVAYLC